MAGNVLRWIARRDFLKMAGGATVSVMTTDAMGAFAPAQVAIICDLSDVPVRLAVNRLMKVLGPSTIHAASPSHIHGANVILVVSKTIKGSPLSRAESFRLTPGNIQGVPTIWVNGADTRGLVYGVLELMDRVRAGEDLSLKEVWEERPANRVRSICRSYVSDIEDRAWFYDKQFWPDYLDMLVENRFNRFAMTFGLNYDSAGSLLHKVYVIVFL